MKENIEKLDTYTLGKPYTVKHVSSDLLQMSCYGWHFTNWTDENGATIDALSTCIFEVSQKSLSANWERNIYDVNFWLDNSKSGEPYASFQIEYLSSCETPQNPSKTGWRFDKWISQDSSYSLENLQKVSCFMEFVANFIMQYYVSFKRNSQGDAGESLCTLTCDQGSNVRYPQDYPDINQFKNKWPCYTVSSFTNQSGITNIQANQNIYIDDIPNKLSTNCTTSNFKYDGKNHYVEVSSVTRNPYYEGSYDVKYATDEIEWRSEKIPFKNTGNYELSVKVSQDNYFDGISKIYVTITNKDTMTFTFYGVYDNDEWKNIPKSVVPHYPIEVIPVPQMTLSSEFDRWSDENYNDPSAEKNSTSAIYKLRKFTATYYYDDVVPGLTGKIGENTVEYGGDALEARPQLESYGYANDGWCYKKTGRTPAERNMVADQTLSVLTSDISVYTFSRKYHNISLFNVKSDVGAPEVSSNNLSIVDYTYLLPSSIGLSTIPNYEFEKWSPSPTTDGWLVSADNFRISAVYKAKTGTLTYHSHYPEA